MNIKLKSLALAAAVAGGMTAMTASAVNPNHNILDLVLTFQNPGGSTGGSSTMMVSLLPAAANFRDATPGSFTLLLNIGTELTNTFGSNWWNQTTLFMGAAGFRGTNEDSNTLQVGDPHRTIYLTQARDSIGTVGSANSNVLNVGNTTNQSGVSSAVSGMQNIMTNYTTRVVVSPTSESLVDDNNPISAGIQGPGYGAISGGVQDNFFNGSLGSFGAAGTIELALDLYRAQGRNDIEGQYGFGDPLYTGKFLGTLTINQNGDVGFTSVVPEPSTMALVGLAMAGLVTRRRRSH